MRLRFQFTDCAASLASLLQNLQVVQRGCSLSSITTAISSSILVTSQPIKHHSCSFLVVRRRRLRSISSIAIAVSYSYAVYPHRYCGFSHLLTDCAVYSASLLRYFQVAQRLRSLFSIATAVSPSFSLTAQPIQHCYCGFSQ